MSSYGSVITLVQPLQLLSNLESNSDSEIVSINEESAAFLMKTCQLNNDSGCMSAQTLGSSFLTESDNHTLSSSSETDSRQNSLYPSSYNEISDTHNMSDYQKVEMESWNMNSCSAPAAVKELAQDEFICMFDDEIVLDTV